MKVKVLIYTRKGPKCQPSWMTVLGVADQRSNFMCNCRNHVFAPQVPIDTIDGLRLMPDGSWEPDLTVGACLGGHAGRPSLGTRPWQWPNRAAHWQATQVHPFRAMPDSGRLHLGTTAPTHADGGNKSCRSGDGPSWRVSSPCLYLCARWPLGGC